MDSMIENYLKGHGCPDKTKKIQHYIQNDSALKRRLITMAILVRSINNVGYKERMLERMKDDTWLNYYFKYGSMAQKLIYTNQKNLIMDILNNKIIMLLRSLGTNYELGGLIYAICELKAIQLTISSNNHIINSETKRMDKEFKELYETTQKRCKELNLDWNIVENALTTIEKNILA